MWHFERKPNSFFLCAPFFAFTSLASLLALFQAHRPPPRHHHLGMPSSEPSPLLFPLPFPTFAELLPQFKNVTPWQRSFLVI